MGDQVRISRKLPIDTAIRAQPLQKLSPRRVGRFTIPKLFGRNAVKVSLPSPIRSHNVIHVSWPRPYVPKLESLGGQSITESPAVSDTDSGGHSIYRARALLVTVDEVKDTCGYFTSRELLYITPSGNPRASLLTQTEPFPALFIFLLSLMHSFLIFTECCCPEANKLARQECNVQHTFHCDTARGSCVVQGSVWHGEFEYFR